MRGSADAVAVARDVASSSPSKVASALDLMRYPRPTSDGLTLANGIGSGGGASKKSAVTSTAPATTAAPRSSKDDVAPAVAADSSRLAAFLASTPLETKPRPRATHPQPPPAQAAPSSAPTTAANHSNGNGHGQHPSSNISDPPATSTTGTGTGGSELLLQWGQNKRMRCRRDTSSSSPQRRHGAVGIGGNKIPRRSSSPAADNKLMPPPSAAAPYTRGSNLRPASPLLPRSGSSDAIHGRIHHPLRSTTEDRVTGAAGKFSAAAARAEKKQLAASQSQSPSPSPHKVVGPGPVIGLGVPEPKPQPHPQPQQQHNLNQQQSTKPAMKLELPRIYTTLSRKEKEEDFMAIKGTKLPQRPKRRPKNVEKTVNAICPGMWLTDVTRSRYEVREKKCPKKQQKYRGLKGLESMDSDSD